jgi:hypothetical protein
MYKMNKVWIITVVLVCTAGILGFYYNQGETASKAVLSDDVNHTNEKLQEQDEAAAEMVFFGNLSYTDEELQELYQKYNITENDLKFAKGELPNYLEGTVLHSDLRVTATSIGEPPEGLKEGIDYDVLMSEQEMGDIIEDAREAYIQKYGIDPANPKLDSVNGYLLPVEEVKRLVCLDKSYI